MAWTFTTLKTAIQDYTQNSESTFVTNLPVIITQAEDRILKSIQLPEFRKNAVGAMTSGNQYVAMPTDFLYPYSLSVDNTGFEFLLFKDVNFIREAYPQSSVQGVPKYYAIYSEAFFIVGPTPNANFSVELHYFHKPESITTATSWTSWLGTNAELALMYASLVEAYTFMKGEPDLLQLYNQRYMEALQTMKNLGEGKNNSDQYRYDNIRRPPQ